jgi:hypothetical protein
MTMPITENMDRAEPNTNKAQHHPNQGQRQRCHQSQWVAKSF